MFHLRAEQHANIVVSQTGGNRELDASHSPLASTFLEYSPMSPASLRRSTWGWRLCRDSSKDAICRSPPVLPYPIMPARPERIDKSQHQAWAWEGWDHESIHQSQSDTRSLTTVRHFIMRHLLAISHRAPPQKSYEQQRKKRFFLEFGEWSRGLWTLFALSSRSFCSFHSHSSGTHIALAEAIHWLLFRLCCYLAFAYFGYDITHTAESLLSLSIH